MLDSSDLKMQAAQRERLFRSIKKIRRNLLLNNSESTAYLSEMEFFTTKEEVIKSFDYLLDGYRRSVLIGSMQEHKMQNRERIEIGLDPRNFSIRFEQSNAKGHLNILPKTLNIVENKDGELMLLMEQEIDPDRLMKYQKYSGRCSGGYDIYRIDSSKPEAWVSTVIVNDETIPMKLEDASLSQKLYKKSLEIGQNPIPFNYVLVGNSSYGINLNDNVMIPTYSFFTPKAEGNLQNFIYNHPSYSFQFNQHLSRAAKYKMLLSLLKGLKSLHDMGMAHQDVTLQNILVYQLPDDSFYLVWIDFEHARAIEGATVDDLREIGTPVYDSPERILAELDSDNPDPDDAAADDDCTFAVSAHRKVNSYGRGMAKTLPAADERTLAAYRLPSRSHDMWSFGLVSYCFLTNDLDIEVETLRLDAEIQINPFLKGLLEPQPEKRFNIDQAIHCLEQMIAKEAQHSLMPPTAYLPQSNLRKVNVQPSNGDDFRVKRAKYAGFTQLKF